MLLISVFKASQNISPKNKWALIWKCWCGYCLMSQRGWLSTAGAQKDHHAEVMIVSFWKIPAGGRRVFKHLTASPIKKREKSSTWARWITLCRRRRQSGWSTKLFSHRRVPVRITCLLTRAGACQCESLLLFSFRLYYRTSQTLYAIIWARVSQQSKAPCGERDKRIFPCNWCAHTHFDGTVQYSKQPKAMPTLKKINNLSCEFLVRKRWDFLLIYEMQGKL